ncbi:13785_t:CDS:2 [Racocetra fulgida]|uniref:13785_t:CDS:1 n=1 Tax=Racocetra fulgida TaxID=60492 RepID=A0A9N9A335_9GLOM|nr:13785_t:CDS:2 [Racocetra fulgida]
MDSTIRVWNLPPQKRDNYGPIDSPLNFTTYIGHTDAIWDLRLFPICNLNTQFLASASADGTVKIWNTEAEGSPLKSSWGYYGNDGELPVNGGKCNFSMLAHLDSVTTLDIDPSGMILISGGHDTSIRLWDIVSTRQCVQEFVSHRRKSDEGVLCVEYHRSLPWMASGGADSVVKIYC